MVTCKLCTKVKKPAENISGCHQQDGGVGFSPPFPRDRRVHCSSREQDHLHRKSGSTAESFCQPSDKTTTGTLKIRNLIHAATASPAPGGSSP